MNSNNSDKIAPTKQPTVEEPIHEKMKYKNFEHEPSDDLKMSLAPPSNLKDFNNITPEKIFIIPQKPTRGLEQQVVQWTTTDPNWSQPISEENMFFKSFPPEILHCDVHQDIGMTNRSFLYSNDKSTSAQ